MARQTEADRVKVWQDRLKSACKIYDEWYEQYEVKRLEEYYLGRQWKGLTDEEAKKLYVINMVFSTIEVNKPSMIFHHPQFRMQPRPGKTGTLGSQAEARCKLAEDTVQTFVEDRDVRFHQHTALALHEAHFAFGVIEVGYTADWIDNPNAGKPVLKEDDKTEVLDENGQQVLEPELIPETEHLYVKRIPASQFRVALSNKNALDENDWYAYYEWHYLEDIKENIAYDNTKKLKASGVVRDELRGSGLSDDEIERYHGMVKLWKIWDVRKKVRHVIAADYDRFLIEAKPVDFFPHSIMKFYEVLDSFYPCPPVYQWLMPQDEINETRESQRAHRRRFYRRYEYTDGRIDENDVTKFETGGDGAMVKVQGDAPVIRPIADAPMGADVWQHLDATKTDWLSVTGIGGDQRGVAESETATQANIIDTRARLRETSSRTKVADWLAEIARLMVLVIRENMTLPLWVKRNVDPTAIGAQEDAMMVAGLYQQIIAGDIDNVDLDVFVELASMSPVTEDVQRMSWNQVLALITNPQLVMLLAQSEVLLRKTLSLYGIKSETEVREIMRVMNQTIMMMQQAQAAQQEAEVKKGAADAGVSQELINATGAGAPPAEMQTPPGPMTPMAPGPM